MFINEREVMFTQKAHARLKYVIIWHNQQAFFSSLLSICLRGINASPAHSSLKLSFALTETGRFRTPRKQYVRKSAKFVSYIRYNSDTLCVRKVSYVTSFAYCRVSTLEQNTENQRHEIEAAGFAIRPQRLIEEHISGSVAASERPWFIRLLDRMESGDVLIVTKLDRLGRNAMDIRKQLNNWLL
nr:Putative DNA-invertase from lambdoid prophage Rac [Klebsiella pneumoniae]